MKNPYKTGMSIVEVMVVIAILAVLFGIVISQFAKIRERQVIKAGVENTLTSIDKARTQTLASLNSSEYGIHFQSDKIVIFTGRVYSSGVTSNESIFFTSPASLTNVTLGGVSGTSGDMYFSRLFGSPSATGTVTLTTSSYVKIITISATGLATSN